MHLWHVCKSWGSADRFINDDDAECEPVLAAQPSIVPGPIPAFDEFAELAGPASQAIEFRSARAVCLAHLGRREEALALVGPRLEQIEGSRDEDDANTYAIESLLQAAVLLGDQPAALALAKRLAPVAQTAILADDQRRLVDATTADALTPASEISPH
jgi:hypothetical protein